jgi:ABC-2 type transport system permease protein
MFGLVIKDLLVQKKMIYRSLLFLLPLGVFMKTSTPFFGFFFALMLIWFNPVMQLFVLEEKNKSEIILNSLPLSRVEIVVSRYLTCLIFFVYAICLVSLCCGALKLAGIAGDFNFGLTVLFAFGISALQISLMFPIFFRWGYSKTTGAVMMAFFMPFFLVGILGPHLPKINPALIRSALALPDAAKAGIVFLLAAILIYLSIALSIRCYKAREF